MYQYFFLKKKFINRKNLFESMIFLGPIPVYKVTIKSSTFYMTRICQSLDYMKETSTQYHFIDIDSGRLHLNFEC